MDTAGTDNTSMTVRASLWLIICSRNFSRSGTYSPTHLRAAMQVMATDRGKVTDQVVTEHSIKVTIIDGAMESVVTDEKWDELGQFTIGSELSLSCQPKMYTKTPWQVWEENSGRVYIRAPTDEEIIKNYYQSVYSIEVRDVKKIQPGIMICQACNV